MHANASDNTAGFPRKRPHRLHRPTPHSCAVASATRAVPLTGGNARAGSQKQAAGDEPNLAPQQAAIAVRLGYKQPRTFLRAFKRWTALTPGQYRHHVSVAGAIDAAGTYSAAAAGGLARVTLRAGTLSACTHVVTLSQATVLQQPLTSADEYTASTVYGTTFDGQDLYVSTDMGGGGDAVTFDGTFLYTVGPQGSGTISEFAPNDCNDTANYADGVDLSTAVLASDLAGVGQGIAYIPPDNAAGFAPGLYFGAGTTSSQTAIVQIH